ncbi:MAG: DNA repair protein RecN [Bacteroidota bacterium]
MLRSLYIRDYALIEQLEVEFDSGLNIITGETGAGKSILLGALKMILGERASMEVVRTNAKKAVIEGLFDEADQPNIRALLAEHDIDPMPELILRREITRSHSRAFVNDTPTTIGVLKKLAANVIDLHGQHEHQSLLRTELHIEMLDNFGSLGTLLDHYQRHYHTVGELHKRRTELVRKERQLRQQTELYAFQIEEIDRIAPQAGEEETLEAEARVLENAERLHDATAELYAMLYESEDTVHDRLVVARNELQDLARISPEFEDALTEIRSAQIVVAEIANFLQDYNANIEFNPGRLEDIRARLGELDLLKRKYGGTIAQVIAHRAEIGEQYELGANFEEAIADLDQQIAKAEQALSESAHKLSSKRREVADRIERAIVAELKGLGIPHSQFEVRFRLNQDKNGWIVPPNATGSERYTAHTNGMDEVEFYISTNMGEMPKPLARVASGGEISRIMLALKTILAKSERLPILVFDEIDTGISGEMARKVGLSMADLAQYHQIITITHHPQIAALGTLHFKVSKRVAKGRTRTQIRRLSEDERSEEVASLISGADISEAALVSARELMAAGRRDD